MDSDDAPAPLIALGTASSWRRSSSRSATVMTLEGGGVGWGGLGGVGPREAQGEGTGADNPLMSVFMVTVMTAPAFPAHHGAPHPCRPGPTCDRRGAHSAPPASRG
jgi:hypothetical protein